MSSWWRPSSSAEEPEDKVQTRRQAAAAAAATTEASDVPTPRPEEHFLRGRELNRVQKLQQRVRSRSRDNSPAPSQLPEEETAFKFPDVSQPPPAMDDEAIQRIVRMALEQDREERDRQSQLATQAAVAAALANQTSQVQALRRPDLPPFDKEHIEVWIRRVEFAYARSSITRPTDKFAFLEKMFHAKDDSKINAFLWGIHNDEKWNEFLAYLKERYGRTKKQEVVTLLDGIPRDGRRPTALAELLNELTPTVTIDDIKKEVFLKQMPATVRQLIADKVDDLTFMETAEACDKHFDQSGKLKESSNATTVNHVSSLRQPCQQQQQQQQQPTSFFTSPFATDEDAEAEVSAVRFRDGQRQSFSVSNRSASRGRSSSNNYSGGNSNSNLRSNGFSRHASANASSNNANANSSSKKTCKFHSNYGKDAHRCEGNWCLFSGTEKAPKGQASR